MSTIEGTVFVLGVDQTCSFRGTTGLATALGVNAADKCCLLSVIAPVICLWSLRNDVLRSTLSRSRLQFDLAKSSGQGHR